MGFYLLLAAFLFFLIFTIKLYFEERKSGQFVKTKKAFHVLLVFAIIFAVIFGAGFLLQR